MDRPATPNPEMFPRFPVIPALLQEEVEEGEEEELMVDLDDEL